MPYYVNFVTEKPLGRSHTGGILHKVFVGENKAKNKGEARRLALRNTPNTFRETIWGMGDGTGSTRVIAYKEDEWTTSVEHDRNPETCKNCGSVKIESDIDKVIVSEKDWSDIQVEDSSVRPSSERKIDKLENYVVWDSMGDKKCQNCIESKKNEFEWDFSEVFMGISIVFLLIVLISSFALL